MRAGVPSAPSMPGPASRPAYRSEGRNPYAILRPVQTKPPPIDVAESVLSGVDGARRFIAWIHDAASRPGPVGLDVETRGTRPEDPERAIVGIGLAARGVPPAYIDWASLHSLPRWKGRILSLIYDALAHRMVAHNHLFDSMQLYLESGLAWDVPEHPVFRACTFHLTKALAGEGWKGQEWGLKRLMVELLGWPDSNERERDAWLVANGYAKGGPKQRKATKKLPAETRDGWLARLVAAYDKPGSKVRPKLEEMWRVPAAILGPYCCLDATACLWLYDTVLTPALRRFPEFARFHREIFLRNNQILIEQQIDGLRIDRPGFEAYGQGCGERVATMRTALRSDLGIATHIAAWETEHLAAARRPEPLRLKPFRLSEPNRIRKDGGQSKSWETWERKRVEHAASPPVYAKWAAWDARAESLLLPGKKGRGAWEFNLSSPDHLRWLAYERGAIEWKESGEDGMNGHPSILIRIDLPPGEAGDAPREAWIPCDRTKTGGLPTGKRAMQQWGPLGLAILKYREEVKEQSYVEEWLRRAVVAPRGTPYAGTTRVHPGWISPGTLTLRLAGKAPNLAQAPKSIKFMENMPCDDGETWIEDDMASVESVVLCELTRDPVLMKLYGPGVTPSCAYLFNGADLPILGPRIRATGYDPENPTAESVKKAKKEAKPARAAAKVVTLGKQYGMGARKMQSELRLQCGLFLTDAQAETMDAAWKERYRVSGKEFNARLRSEWKQNGGWFLDGLGHPTCVDGDYLKDLISRCVQKTAHSIQMIRIVIVDRLARERGLHLRWRVSDWHDQLIFAVPAADAELGLQLVRDSYRELNEVWLKGMIPIRGEPKVAKDMASAKEAEE